MVRKNWKISKHLNYTARSTDVANLSSRKWKPSSRRSKNTPKYPSFFFPLLESLSSSSVIYALEEINRIEGFEVGNVTAKPNLNFSPFSFPFFFFLNQVTRQTMALKETFALTFLVHLGNVFELGSLLFSLILTIL